MTVKATYSAYGQIESPPYSVAILPRFTVRLTYELGTAVLGNQIVHFTAATSGPNGPAPANAILWDLDGDGVFDEAAGATASSLLPLGRTSLIGVRATDSAGAFDFAYQYVPAERRASSEPDSEPMPDVSDGAFTDGNGDSFTFDAAKAAAGLVVVTHGMFDKASSRWMKDMATRIDARLASAANVCLYDWKEMADPTLYTTGGARSGRDQWALLKIDDFLRVRPYGQAHGRILAELIDAQRALGKVVKSAPVHLIGHSAGGFVVGECARQLRRKGYSNLQITMLDTPAPFVDHVQAETLTPAVDPVVAERFITTEWGGKGPLNLPKNTDFEKHAFVSRRSPRYTTRLLIQPSATYVRKVIGLPRDERDTVTTTATAEIGEEVSEGVLLHFWAHEWYLETVDANPDFPGGFNSSPLLVPAPSPPPLAANSVAEAEVIQANGSASDVPLDGFQTFGDVTFSGGIYAMAETGNAGIHKAISIPVGARTLRFRLRATGPTDGDMVVVEWNGVALMVIVNPAANGGAFFNAEADLAQHARETGVLTIKLVSRNLSAAGVEVTDIAIIQTDDADADGISNGEEALLGTDPLNPDSDDDGLLDGEEMHLFHTEPASGDSDSDGQSDAAEIAAGTDPDDARSVMTVLAFARAGGGVALRWTSVRGKSYRVLRSSGPGFASYEVLASGVVAAGAQLEFVDPAVLMAVVPAMFYRVEAEDAPPAPTLDSDGDGAPDAQEIAAGSDPGRYDTDRDGIGDGEEIFVFNSSPVTTDTDGDGSSDWAELVAGTSPTNPTSRLAITRIVRNVDGRVRVYWSGVPGRTYRVLRSATPDFSAPTVLATGRPGIAPETTFIDATVTGIGNSAAFYSVAVE